jgi:hypothetical protein
VPGRKDDPNRFELANGITLTLREASPMLLLALNKQTEADKPQVPMIIREDRDGREEPNEDDPDYKAAQAKWALGVGNRAIHMLAAACVTVNKVPDGIPKHDSDDWATQVTVVYGLDLEDNPTLRMVQWLYLQTTQKDLDALTVMLLAHAGPAEQEVQDALDSFRRIGQRSADTSGASNGSRADGDTVPAPSAGNRAARRRAASS